MNKAFFSIVVFASLSASITLADEVIFDNVCDYPSVGDSCVWHGHDLPTGSVGPKQFYGDTNTAYAGFGASNSYVYKIEGSFFSARFMSFESSLIRTDIETSDAGRLVDFDSIFDYEMVPNEDSANPFTSSGVYIPGDGFPGPYEYTVYVVPENYTPHSDWKNVLYVSQDMPFHLISFRVVAPNAGVVLIPSDLPKITRSKQPVIAAQPGGEPNQAVPTTLESFQYSLDNPTQLLLDSGIADPRLLEMLYPEKRWRFKFDVVSVIYEGNGAVPDYGIGVSRMTHGNVAMIRFKAPSFVNTYPATEAFYDRGGRDLRFFSLCSVDFLNGLGLACLADHLSKPDNSGYVTLVFGPPSGRVEKKAVARGHNFLPDTRTNSLLVLAYRQILPSSDFIANRLHKGEYLPSAIICSQSEFVLGICEARLKKP